MKINSLIFENEYGVIPQNFPLLNGASDKSLYDSFHITLQNAGCFYNCIKILDNWFFEKSHCQYELYEYNPDSKVICDKWCRGTYTEIEYKINILSSCDIFFDLFDDVNLSGFSRGTSSVMPSFEEYFFFRYLQKGQAKENYYVLIRENYYVKPNAIKFKMMSNGKILTRKVNILDYSEKNLEYVKEYLIKDADYIIDGPIKLPAFLKKKKRFPVIDERTGFLYGVSYSIANLLGHQDEIFCQVELEYWSKLTKKGRVANDNYIDLLHSSYNKLINSAIDSLGKIGVSFNEKQTTKIEWLQSRNEF